MGKINGEKLKGKIMGKINGENKPKGREIEIGDQSLFYSPE